MQRILIVGGSKGVGYELVNTLIDQNEVHVISRSTLSIKHQNLKHYQRDIINEELPELEGLDAIVYCPGSINLKPLSRLSLQDFRDDYEINLIGAVKVIQFYLPLLKKSPAPAIVLFSTVAAKLGMPYHASIAAAKSAIEGLTKSLAAEFAPLIRVNAIAPTVTNTTLAANLLRNDRMKENITERHPLKKYLEPKEVAHMAEFLLSDKASSFSGQIFEMDYGLVSLKL